MCNTVGHALLIRCTVHQRDTELSWGWSSCCLLTCEESDQLDEQQCLDILFTGETMAKYQRYMVVLQWRSWTLLPRRLCCQLLKYTIRKRHQVCLPFSFQAENLPA